MKAPAGDHFFLRGDVSGGGGEAEGGRPERGVPDRELSASLAIRGGLTERAGPRLIRARTPAGRRPNDQMIETLLGRGGAKEKVCLVAARTAGNGLETALERRREDFTGIREGSEGRKWPSENRVVGGSGGAVGCL